MGPRRAVGSCPAGPPLDDGRIPWCRLPFHVKHREDTQPCRPEASGVLMSRVRQRRSTSPDGGPDSAPGRATVGGPPRRLRIGMILMGRLLARGEGVFHVKRQ